jgi:hypothetical protein
MNWGGCGRSDRPQTELSISLLNRILFYYKWFNYEAGTWHVAARVNLRGSFSGLLFIVLVRSHSFSVYLSASSEAFYKPCHL